MSPARRFAAQETTVYRDLQNSMRRLGATSLRVGQRDLMDGVRQTSTRKQRAGYKPRR